MTALENELEIVSLQVYLKNYKDYKSDIHVTTSCSGGIEQQWETHLRSWATSPTNSKILN